ncbi:MAG: GatB/YqeY domain-containing protein [Nocardioidaceae bacterium]|jgi:uncharacterized protein YqeY
MSSMKDRLRTELTASMKARDQLRSSTLRLVLTAIANAEVAGKQARELSDDDITGILASQAKMRREAATAFDGARPELASKERSEAAIIQEFLPEPMPSDEIAAMVATIIEQLGVHDAGMQAMGRVMGAVTPLTLGRADGGVVSAEVRRQLS